MNYIIWFVFIVAAILEVGGDAAIRRGLRARGPLWILTGAMALALYGLLVNSVKWDFSRLLGVYIAFFAALSLLFGRFVFHENISASTWSGLALIILGGLVIQFGR